MLTTLPADTLKCMTSINSSGESRKLITSIAISKAMADILPLPTEAMDDTHGYFNSNFYVGLSEKLDPIYNLVVFNYDEVRKLVERFWLLRYNMVHNTGLVTGQGLISFLNINQSLDQEVLKVIEESDFRLSYYYNHFIIVLREVSKTWNG